MREPETWDKRKWRLPRLFLYLSFSFSTTLPREPVSAKKISYEKGVFCNLDRPAGVALGLCRAMVGMFQLQRRMVAVVQDIR